MLSLHKSHFLIVVVGTLQRVLWSLRAEHWCTSKWSINHSSSQASIMWKVEKSGRTFWAVSHYLNGYGQMSCVTSWWKAYQNTSGHWNIFASAAPLQELIVSFILPVANVPRPSSFEPCSLLWAGLLLVVSVKCVMLTWVVLGFICRVAELNVKVDAENGVMAVIPRDWGERWETQV